MASIESRIDSFIAEHKLDTDLKENICVLVTGCMEDLFKHVFTQTVPETSKSKKVLKADKVEDPTSCETREELRNCTTGVLNQFCKDHSLKIGGNKTELMDRVWRHLQGQTSDEDKSSRNKPKKEKKTPEKHACFGKNAAGAECGISATETFCGYHFCHRHITDAQKFIEAKDKPTETKPKSAKSKAAKEEKPAKTEKPTKSKKKPEPEPEPEPESEEELEETDEEDQQETDNEM